MAALPIPRAFWPLTLTSANNAIRFTITGGDAAATWNGTIAAATYYDPEALATAAAAAIAHASDGSGEFQDEEGADDSAVTVSSAGVMTIDIRADGATQIVLAWAGTSATQALGALLGFGTASLTDAAGPFSFTAAAQMQHFWTPGLPVVGDTLARPIWTRAVSETVGGEVRAIQHGDARHRRTLTWEFLEPHKLFAADEGSHANESAERLLDDVAGIAGFRYWPDRDTTATYSTLWLTEDDAQLALSPENAPRHSPGLARYSLRLRCGVTP